MEFKTTKFKVDILTNLTEKNLVDLLSKASQNNPLRNVTENTSTHRVLSDTGWANAELEDITGATSQTLNTLLPQRAKYEYNFSLDIPESYLPFLDFHVLSRTNPDQTILGVGKFTYTGLREVALKLYDWKGVISITAGRPQVGGFTNIPISTPHAPLPSPSMTIPPPESCYDNSVYYSRVSAPLIGSGVIVFPTNRAGTIVNPDTVGEQTLQEWTQGLADTYMITSTSIVFDTAEEVVFKHPTVNFPIPIDPELSFGFPCGTDDTDADSTPTYPTQYWEHKADATFNDLITLYGYTYTEAKNLFETYYPILFITPEEHGSPYKAYVIVDSEVLESAKKNIRIDKVEDGRYDFKISGDVLLVSPADVETDNSDENFPTYKASGEDLEFRLEVLYKNLIEYHQNQRYRKDGKA